MGTQPPAQIVTVRGPTVQGDALVDGALEVARTEAAFQRLLDDAYGIFQDSGRDRRAFEKACRFAMKHDRTRSAAALRESAGCCPDPKMADGIRYAARLIVPD